MLNATSIHADLAKRLLRFYPKLINDIYMCDEYYGKQVDYVYLRNFGPISHIDITPMPPIQADLPGVRLPRKLNWKEIH